MNLLEETKSDISDSGHVIDDIIFIGSLDSGHSCSWREFEKLADFEYDDGFGSQKIGKDLIIAFSDGYHMWRGEYDGSERWVYKKPVKIPEKTKPILCLGGDNFMWCTLAEIEEEMKGEQQ